MSKSIKNMTGTNRVKYDNSANKAYINYLKNYDTSNVDNTLGNLTNYANTASQNLAQQLGNYNFSVDGSEQARQQAQNATYNAYMDRLTPQFQQQTSDLATALANKGLAVGSEAYQRAMNDLQDNQNQATNQAAYQSVLAGNDAFTQDLSNQIAAGNFGNSAQQSYINQLLSALQGSASGYENQQNIYSAGTNAAMNKYNAQAQTAANRLALTNSLLTGGAQIAGKVAGAGAA